MVVSETTFSMARRNLGAELTNLLREAILTGVYAPGQRMPVEELAVRHGVSTMPVRLLAGLSVWRV